MTVSLEAMLAEESEESRARIRLLTQAIREEINLRELRRLRKLTQARLSKKLKIGQEGVSRIEKRSDLYLSTLRSYVEGVGGELTLLVRFPDQQPVFLAGFGDAEGKKTAKKKTRRAAKSKVASKAAPPRAA
jgi:transcriptional regulator with XRE-family HTH domain